MIFYLDCHTFNEIMKLQLQDYRHIHPSKARVLLGKETVDSLFFVGYQFSLFSWRVWSTNSSTYEWVIFCINYEGKYYGHEFSTPWMTFCGIHENIVLHSIYLFAYGSLTSGQSGVLELTVRQNLYFLYQCRYLVYYYILNVAWAHQTKIKMIPVHDLSYEYSF